MKPSRDIQTLIDIMAHLRNPDGGCPWDLEQDFDTIKPHTIEEAYEVAEAIENKDFDELRDELGDLLFQPIYYAQMAKEQNKFDFGDIVYGISAKLIRRHPHVFGDLDTSDPVEVKKVWDGIKAEERAEKAARQGQNDKPKGYLDDIPRGQPALMRADKLAKRAARIGFDFSGPDQAAEKLHEELREVQEEMASDAPTERLHEEIGDLLFAVASLARKLNIDPETALQDANAKFIRRFQHIERGLSNQNVKLDEANFDQLQSLWDEARLADKEEH
ncbi:nucleoside triphosphate pyrophosphohydrolase [Maritalea sp. S77]|uniref:nucleoside triphosphate pyrophosphohydrolase n=1 Tax=Maritalea sp. S77 TaxID=3415125 RepID=UPI003C7DB2EB